MSKIVLCSNMENPLIETHPYVSPLFMQKLILQSPVEVLADEMFGQLCLHVDRIVLQLVAERTVPREWRPIKDVPW